MVDNPTYSTADLDPDKKNRDEAVHNYHKIIITGVHECFVQVEYYFEQLQLGVFLDKSLAF